MAFGPDSAMLAAYPAAAPIIDTGCDGPFVFGPGRVDNPCDRYHFWSLHPGGANFLFADGSARWLSYSAQPLIVPLATRNGGETVSVSD